MHVTHKHTLTFIHKMRKYGAVLSIDTSSGAANASPVKEFSRVNSMWIPENYLKLMIILYYRFHLK
jgi:hypothetical protein